MNKIEENQSIEIGFWHDSKDESPESTSVSNIVNKVSDAAVFIDCIDRYKHRLPQDGRILELGGGQGWASCIYKRLFPACHVTITDISRYAVASLHKWERLWEVKVDNAYACKSYQIDEEDQAIDVVFCFASAHHFLAHRRTLKEICRILRPGGEAFYFYEPACPRLLYPLAYKRVNSKRPEVPEDVLITSNILSLANDCGLDATACYYPSLLRRGPIELLYYFALKHTVFLQRMLPCTANFVFTKPKVKSSSARVFRHICT